MFSFEFCEISKNTFYYRTPLVAASVVGQSISWLRPYIEQNSFHFLFKEINFYQVF